MNDFEDFFVDWAFEEGLGALEVKSIKISSFTLQSQLGKFNF
jgi:hypothetical protein